MKVNEIKEIARQHNIKAGKLKKSELVRAIQQSEKNQPCFDTNYSSECEQHTCLWREDCDQGKPSSLRDYDDNLDCKVDAVCYESRNTNGRGS